jgi:hypothetical protein
MIAKKDILFKIEEPPIDSFSTPGTLWVTGWYKNNPSAMIDRHLCERFSSLEYLELGDLQEGVLEFWGMLSKEELKTELENLGFETVIV